MEIPYYFLGIVFLAVLFVFIIFGFCNLFHVFKFGFFDFTGKLNAFIFCCAWLIILFFTFLFLWKAPWTDTFNLLEEILELF